jgi:hypothetical protein
LLANSQMTNLDQIKLLRSFTDRRSEADRKAREVLKEFIRVAKQLPLDADATAWDELAALNESWRDTLSDSEIIRYLRAIHPDRRRRKGQRRR